MNIHPVVAQVTQRIIGRSAATRAAYLQQIDAAARRDRGADRMGCANVAHAFAAMPGSDKFKVVAEKALNIGIVNAYNDMLSAHAPLQHYPALIKDEARKHGATAQVAGGVPAMCDGVTQGTPAMELSLFSRDTIAMATAVSLSHDMFDCALLLGVCDKIVPGLLIGALHFGHLPTVFVPAGPMTSGLSNNAKAKVRELAAQGLVSRAELLDAESKAYHGQGTCTFYGTANSNQMLLEAMGLHVPGTAFINPDEATGAHVRELLTREAVKTVLSATKNKAAIGKIVDERCIVNAMVALMATGGSTNHLIHWVAVARSAGIVIDWDDFSALSDVVPLLSHVYPNGSADVNQFQAAGGPGYIIRELLDAGFMHADVLTVASGLRDYTHKPVATAQGLQWSAIGASQDESVVRPVSSPFSATGGLKLLQGNLGRSVIKVSSVPDDRHVIEAPAMVFDSQEAMLAAFKTGAVESACQSNGANGIVVVVRWQGPQANGMPELHKLTPPLAVLQGKGYRVALVTDGRMSGASGKVPAAIHVSPEALAGGPLAKLRDGDLVRLDAPAGSLQALVSEADWGARPLATMGAAQAHSNGLGLGRELFAAMRRNALTAEQGACTWL
jgi:phosphogluconate dehydratase